MMMNLMRMILQNSYKKGRQEYIRNQLKEDEMADQISLKEYVDPFTGSKNTKA